MAADDGSFGTGYGKPPERTQFRKGVSGNPAGRPRGSLNVATVLARILREQTVITVDGQRRVVTKLEAVMVQLADKALRGDIAAARQILSLHFSTGLETADVQAKKPLSDSDRRIVSHILERMEHSEKKEDR